MSRMRSLTRSSTVPRAPESPVLAPLVKLLRELSALLDAQDIGGIRQSLGDAAAAGIEIGHLLGSELLDAGAVDGRGGEQLAGALAGRFDLLTQWNEILHRGLHDGAQLVGLLVGGIDLDGEMTHHAIGMLLGPGRVEIMVAHEMHRHRRAVVVAHRTAGGRPGQGRGQRDGRQDQPAPSLHRRRRRVGPRNGIKMIAHGALLRLRQSMKQIQFGNFPPVSDLQRSVKRGQSAFLLPAARGRRETIGAAYCLKWHPGARRPARYSSMIWRWRVGPKLGKWPPWTTETGRRRSIAMVLA